MEQEINGKVQKINDEDYEIIKVIESQSRADAVKWYQENYNCNVEDAICAISAIYKQYKGGYKPDAGEMWLLLNEYAHQGPKDLIKAEDKVKQWLKDNVGIDKGDAQKYINEAWNYYSSQDKKGGNNNDTNGGSKNGCMITILIAITSTLSVLCLL